VLEVHHLAQAFKRHLAVADVSFKIERGSIHGFVGPNGAGKTTTLKVVATLLRPQRGSVRVFGLDVVRDAKEVRRRIGFMPDHFSMYRQMTVFEYLDFFGAAYGLPLAQRNKTITDVLALTDMGARRDDLIKGLSRGMQQRVGLARVLINDPDLLLLDEPASGLDPRARIELMDILQELKRLGKTIFISSHILSELALLCDSVTIIDRGLVRYTGPMRGLLARSGEEAGYALTLAAEHPALEAALAAVPGVTGVTKAEGEPRYVLTFSREKTDVNAVLRAALECGAQVVSFREDEKHLNQAFMDLTEPGVRS
jgi:ABC-2 type transport system ATP-binding protein